VLILEKDFYQRPADQVARDLLGKILYRNTPKKLFSARIVETEAYLGCEDKACHASRGRTPRTDIMFGPSGYIYVYLVYGIHHMLNFVTAGEGEAHAVLIRAAETISPTDLNLSGPGRLTKGLRITKQDNAKPISKTGALYCAEDSFSDFRVETSPRVGIDYAEEWREAPLRFFIQNHPAVSKTKPKLRVQ